MHLKSSWALLVKGSLVLRLLLRLRLLLLLTHTHSLLHARIVVLVTNIIATAKLVELLLLLLISIELLYLGL